MNIEGKDNVMAINARFAQEAAQLVAGAIEERIKAAFKAVLEQNWIEQHQMKLFQAALAGVLMTCEKDDEDWKQIVDSIEALRNVGAFLSLTSIGFKCDMPPLGSHVTLPLYEWWHEVFKATTPKIKIIQ